MTVFFLIPNPFSHYVVATIGLMSIAGNFGNYLVTESIVHGKAGPTSALCEVQSLWLLLLEILISKKVPNVLQMVGFALGIVGGTFIAFGPSDSIVH
jgi:drug/metabolite transporter (DMT)-like permease